MSLLKTKLYSIYQYLDKKERKQFQQLCHSPFFNNNEQVVKFVNYLTKIDELDRDTLDKERVFKQVFGKKAYNDLHLRHVVSATYKLLEEYLAIQNFRKDRYASRLYLARAAREKDAQQYFKKIATDTAREIEEQPDKQIEDYLSLHQLLVDLYNESSAMGRKPEVDLDRVIETFELYTSLNFLHLGISLNNLRNLYKVEYEIGLLPNILDYIQKGKHIDHPLVRINYFGYKIQENAADENSFLQFKQALVDHQLEIHPADIRDAFVLAINYCIRKINTGRGEYLEEIFELYQLGLENRALYEGNLLPTATYKNIVTSGLRLKKFDWVEAFIENYQEDLARTYRHSFHTFCLAQLHFYKGEYEQTIDLLYDVKINELFTELGAKVLVLKSYYELSEYQLLDSLIENFRQLINRRKILSYHKTNFLNFSRYLKRLLSFNYYDHKARAKLIKQIEEEEILTEKGWFLEKVGELK